MDIQKEREEFEKLPAVAELIKTNNVWWSDVHGDYFGSDHELDCWIDGAWAVWQAKSQAVPEGFVLVPRQPSEKTLIKMSWSVELGEDQHGNSVYLSIDEAKKAYEAMIEAQEPTND